MCVCVYVFVLCVFVCVYIFCVNESAWFHLATIKLIANHFDDSDSFSRYLCL